MANDSAKAKAYGALSALRTSELTDFVIKCGKSEWRVHRLVLSIHSKVLKVACAGEFLEAKNREIDLSDHRPIHVESLIDYCYKLDYHQTSNCVSSENLLFHTHVFILADKYDVEGLKELSLKKFHTVMKDIKANADIAATVRASYNASVATREIRKTLVDFVVASPSAAACAELHTVLEKYPQFAIEVWTAEKAAKQPAAPSSSGAPRPKKTLVHTNKQYGLSDVTALLPANFPARSDRANPNSATP